MTPAEWSTNLRAFALGAAIMCAVALLAGCAATWNPHRPAVEWRTR